MKLSDKIARVMVEVDSIAGHDDEAVAEVRSYLQGIVQYVKAKEKALVQRRLGGLVDRVKAYFAKIVAAVSGK